VGIAMSGCTTADGSVEAARPPDTVAILPIVSGTAAATVTEAPTPTEAPTTEAPTTEAPTTEAATTEAPTTEAPTTQAPTTEAATTEAPTTEAPSTVAPLPSNIEVVGAFASPIAAVGNRSGADTAVVQLRLLQLGFWNGGADGKYGKTTQQAVMAFQKYLNLPSTGKVDADTAAWMTAVDTKAHGQSDTGTLVEVDKGKQLLFFIVDGKTQWVLNTSTATGNPYSEVDKNIPGKIQSGISITPDGLWKTNRERPDGWWAGDLGQIYRPKYFRGGVAVHGSNSIPNYPASHGCVRVSVDAMDWIWADNIMPLGITVWVHE
jgi:peptidoglycan hydrolase-like protein with peptidoglycan-binding domain